jgi:hypothetical protein
MAIDHIEGRPGGDVCVHRIGIGGKEVSSRWELDAGKSLQENMGALEKRALLLRDGLEFIVDPNSKAIKVRA